MKAIVKLKNLHVGHFNLFWLVLVVISGVIPEILVPQETVPVEQFTVFMFSLPYIVVVGAIIAAFWPSKDGDEDYEC